MTTTVEDGDKLYGWVRKGGCSHPDCKKAMREGRKYHAIPAGFAVTLPDYHFATSEDAEQALRQLPAR